MLHEFLLHHHHHTLLLLVIYYKSTVQQLDYPPLQYSGLEKVYLLVQLLYSHCNILRSQLILNVMSSSLVQEETMQETGHILCMQTSLSILQVHNALCTSNDSVCCTHVGMRCHHSLKAPENGSKTLLEIGGIQYIIFTCNPGYLRGIILQSVSMESGVP